jgi:hypothetical protein
MSAKKRAIHAKLKKDELSFYGRLDCWCFFILPLCVLLTGGIFHFLSGSGHDLYIPPIENVSNPIATPGADGWDAAFIIGTSLFMLVLISWGFWWRSRTYSEFNSVTCVGGVIRLHPTSKGVERQNLKRAKQGKEPKEEPPPHRKSWLTRKNILALTGLLFDFFQLSSLATYPELYPEDVPIQEIHKIAFLDFPVTVNVTYTTYWSILGLIFIWLMISNVLMHAFWTWNYSYVNSLPFHDDLISGFSGPLFMILVDKCLRWASCTWDETIGIYTLDIAQDIQCWTGSHPYYCCLALVLMMLYVLSALSIGIFFLESPNPETDIRWMETYIVMERNFKLMILIVRIFLTHIPILGILLELICFSILSRTLLKTPARKHTCSVGHSCSNDSFPCSIEFLNYLKGAFYMICAWASFTSFIAAIVDAPDDSWVPFICMLLGVVSIIVACLRLMHIAYSNGELRFFEQVPQEITEDVDSFMARTLTVDEEYIQSNDLVFDTCYSSVEVRKFKTD